ncbi:protein transport protein HofC [Escherichia coli]|nr:protein transport protein HofC [Escherichia coli]MWE80676.1 protein transport protein HofC [Escherichia coli]
MNIPQLTALCLRYHGVLLDASEEVVHVAVVDAPSHELLDALHFATTKRIEITCWTRQQMEGHASRTQQTLPVAVQEKHQPKAELLTRTLQSALEQRASDIHIEPADNAYRIRLRIDGVLHPLPDVSPDAGVALTARLKVLGNLDIAEHRLPQDGQFTVELAGNAVSFRIATLPCRGGEKVVLRLLQQVGQALDVNTLGMQPLQLADFAHALQQPQGLVLVTGPTGSGKTVTLYSALQKLNTADINICSVEDPVEIPIAGLNQTQIHPRAGLTFQGVLRALLRQDPDVIMIGEIRDGETAEIAIKAAQTGHLVLSTPLSLKRIAINSAQWRGDKSAEVIHQLATLLKAGLTLSEGLALLAEQHPSKQWQALLQSLAHDLEQGIAFSNALLPWSEVFPPLYQAMIRTGELTGKLDECCFELARQQKAQRQLTDKVKSALRYPIIILAMAIMVVVAMLHFVLPEFAAIYKTFNTPLPALTQGIMTLADFSGEWSWLLVLFGFLLAIANKLLMRRPTWLIVRQKLLLRIPIMGSLMRGQKLTQIFTILALTQSAGITFLQGVESVRETMRCPYWVQLLTQIQHDISNGQPIWLALKNTGEFSPLCLQLVRTGEASGSLDLMLDNLAHHHRENTMALADNLAALLEPALLIITGGIIGTLVVAMYLPIFHLGDAMSGMG